MLQIKNVCKEYKTGKLVQKALDNVSLNLRDNEFVAILGPSGSGKTTLLNIIGGLDRYDSGDLIINNISTKEYKDKDWDSYRNHTIGFVFQSYNLIPHQSLLSNVELALTISGISKNERRRRAKNALEQVGLGSQAHKKPNQLSGGQMQRVAIARALVNDPDILLADEPTGALDSATSIQVMNLLSEVAKDRLVVMVTHNPELAEEYATRIVNLKDGVILSDSNPCKGRKTEKSEIKYQNLGHTSMSFLTSLLLSFHNLKTKKGRTLLTAFAGSIGIIGIALILSLSNGVNAYIKNIEEETLSEYPIQIQSTGFDISAFMNIESKETKKNQENEMEVSKRIVNMFSKIGKNDLDSLKEYLESDESGIKEYTKAVEYTYNVTPRIYSNDTKNLRQLNPDMTFNSLGMGSSVSSNSMMSSMMSTDVFFQMPSDTSLYEHQYDVKKGRWPKNYNECVLVLTSEGNIIDLLLYTLGLRDYKELDDIVEEFMVGENVTTPDFTETYSYDDILGHTFKLINSTDLYQYDKKYKIWKDKSDNKKYMKKLVQKGENLSIVGIVAPKKDATVTMLQPGIGYSSSLINHIIEKSSESDIVKKQLAKKNVNVFTGKKFDDTSKDNGFKMDSLMKIDNKKLKKAFKVDASKIKVDFSQLENVAENMNIPPIDIETILKNLQFSISEKEMNTLIQELLKGYEEYLNTSSGNGMHELTKQLSEYLSSKEASEIIQEEIEKAIQENGSFTITQEQMQKILDRVLEGYEQYAKDHGYMNIEMMEKTFLEFLNSKEAKEILSKSLTNIIKSQNLDKQIKKIIETYMKSAIKVMSKSIEKEMTSSISALSKSMAQAISIDTKTFASAFKMNMSEEELTELMASLMSKEVTTYENNLKKLDYADYDEPSGINLFPRDFEGNKAITNLLSEYNERMKREGEEDKVISYTDMVGTLMSSVTTIINVISYVLIAFVSISLVVSSIMIGVITFISVLERKKEIGILRAMGASKQNVAQVFNAETFIIGACAGFMGIGITLILLIPINKLIAIISDGANVKALLPLGSSIILIVLSTILTLIGGLIPSKKAAKEDPVLALRSE